MKQIHISFFIMALCVASPLLGGCNFVPPTNYQACEVNNECPDGYSCSGRFCHPAINSENPSGFDKTTVEHKPDTEVTIDAGELFKESGSSNSEEPPIENNQDTPDATPPDTNPCLKFSNIGNECNTGGMGVCSKGKMICKNRRISCIKTATPQAETCDGVDNNCNGQVDENLGDIMCGIGECRNVIKKCLNGRIQTCTPGNPSPERCNKLDDNCDGRIDEGVPNCCTSGETRVCGSSKIGGCKLGGQKCSASRKWDACVGNIDPVTEKCNGLDDNCNGKVDDGLQPLSCGLKGSPCYVVVASCISGKPATCISKPPTKEICDGIDNDCDGKIDNKLAPAKCGKGPCAVSITSCINGKPQSCTPDHSKSTTETCDGLDNDCDGLIDEGLGTLNCGLGPCSNSVQRCIGGVQQTCIPKQASTEVCDGTDNNCNGRIDDVSPATLATDAKNCGKCNNKCLQYPKAAPACIAGACVLACTNKWFNPENNTASLNITKGCYCVVGSLGVEACNNYDDDCDGIKDEGCQSLEMLLRAVPGPTYIPDESMKARVGYTRGSAKLNSTDKILVASVDTTGGYIDVAFVSTMPPLSTGTTLAFWIKLKAFNASSILVRRGALTICKIGTGSVDCSCQTQGNRIKSKTSIPYRWTHVAFVTTSNRQSMYINGKLESTSSAACSSDKNAKFAIGENTSALFDAILYASKTFSAAEILRLYRIQKVK